jgi:hypothetical protein
MNVIVSMGEHVSIVHVKNIQGGILIKPMSKNPSGRANAADLNALASPTLFTTRTKNGINKSLLLLSPIKTGLTHPWKIEIVVHLTSPSLVSLTVPRSARVVSPTER